MRYNIFSFLLLSFCFALVGCNSSYNMMKDSGVNDELIGKDAKLNSDVKCELCPSCNQDYRYFYVCSHGCILMVCHECETPYDVSYEAKLTSKEHKIKIEDCFSDSHKIATQSDLEEAGLGDCINKLGFLDEGDEDEEDEKL